MDLNNISWRKSSHSTNNGGQCVELGALPNAVVARDSKDPDGPRLVFDRRAFAEFLTSVERWSPDGGGRVR
ncbi:hypothetical protein GCM10009527_063890 [Actinomadura nitritigenes]|uniref:DUF397 domain-containing protein n=1 Tax=Actinomadura nitritigenes TaxID=134602 RepID=A0ABS3RCX7_9ACTN|nr:DUF397 domain-containing protein [Actinomadura nitritigenes]MBO2444087.1 DUF397 domain-containing protein [Actinomadura nitritigenes]